ncbi:MAG TPA: hypothetical protein DER35_00510 [Acidobacteria bacterium]|jgi:membrane protease YdiL (CAAX protease family)|nr:hypothetical protein [Acidobacteriota bacterium]
MTESSSTGARSSLFHLTLGLATLISTLGLGEIVREQWKNLDFKIPDLTAQIQSVRATFFSEPGAAILGGLILLLLAISLQSLLKQLIKSPHVEQAPWTLSPLTVFAFFIFWFIGFLCISLTAGSVYKKWSHLNPTLVLILIPYALQMAWGMFVLLRLGNFSWLSFIKQFSFQISPGDGRKIFQMFTLALVLVLTYSAVMNLFLRDPQSQARLHEILGQSRSWTQWIPSGIALTILAPLYEEIIFRGIFLTWLRPRIRIEWAVLLSGVVFALFHMEIVAFPALALLGCILAWSYLISQSILVPITIHALWNLTALLGQIVRP